MCVLLVGVIAGGCTEERSPASPPPLSPSGEAAEWRALAPARTERTEVAATAAGTRIYVAGGYEADGGTVATVEVFETRTGRWTDGPDLPVAVNHAMAATVGGAVHVFGGYLSDGNVSDAVFRLDGAGNGDGTGDGWRRVARLPEGRAAGTAVVVGERVYVAGGVGPNRELAQRMLVYDAETDSWATADGPPTPREHLGGAAFGGKVYTVGGRTAFPGTLAAFEAYDPRTDEWTKLPALPTPRGGLAATATCSGFVVAVGGEAESGTFAEAEVFNVRTRSWHALPALPTPRHGLGVVAVGTVVHTLSGGPEPGLHVANDTEAIDLAGFGGSC